MKTRHKNTKVSSSKLPDKKLTIPVEVLSMIINYFQHDQSTLAKCCLVSKSMLDIAAPLLYRKVFISPPGQDSTRHGMRTSPRKTEYLKLAEHLVIETHREMWCEGRNLSLPKIHTLTLNPSSAAVYRDYLEPSMGDHASLDGCVLLNHLRPKRVIIRNANLLDIRIPSDTPSEILSRVEELVFISPSNVSPNPGTFRSTTPFSGMKKLKKFTWIFWTSSYLRILDGWRLTSDNRRGRDTLEESVSHLADVIFNLPSLTECQVTIVNAGCLREMTWAKFEQDEVQRQVKRYIESGLMEASGLVKERGEDMLTQAEKKLERKVRIVGEGIEYLTMNEYLRREDWEGKGIFEKNEVRGWIEGLSELGL